MGAVGRHVGRLPFVIPNDGRQRKDVTVDGRDWQTEEFERHRRHLRAVAHRMLGSLSDADAVVQEAWLRLNRSGADSVENLRGWLTTVVARLALDVLRDAPGTPRGLRRDMAPRADGERRR